MKAKRFTKLVAWLLCVLMIAACLPAAALAEWEGDIDLNPVALTTGDNEVTVAFAQQGAAASFSAAPGIYEISLALPEGSDAGMASMKVNGTEKWDGEPLNVTVANPDEIIDITEIYVYDASIQYTTGKVIINVVLLVEGNGTAEFPYAIGGSDEDGNLIETATITVPAGQTVYYSSIYADYTMTISGANGFVVEQGGVQYEDEYGEVSIVIPESAMQGNPALLSVTNNTESEQTYNVTYTLVETDTTERLTLGVEATHSFIENDEYYSYKYIAEKDGELLIHISSTTGWQLVVNEEDMYYSDADSESVPFSYTVATGDEILITVLTQNDEDPWGDLPAGDVTVKVEYKEEVILPSGNAELKVATHSLVLNSDLTVNFKVANEVFDNYENVYMVFQMEGANGLGEKVIITEHAKDGVRQSFSFKGVAPYMMKDTIHATLYGTYQGVEYSYEEEYHAADYCYLMLQQGDSYKNYKYVVVELLNYGTAHQYYANNYRVDEFLINDGLTEEQKSTYGYSDPIEPKNNRIIGLRKIDNPTATIAATGLMIDNKVNVRVTITCDDLTDVTVRFVTPEKTVSVSAENFVSVSGNKYYVYFDGMEARMMSHLIEITVMRNGVEISNTDQFSIETYVNLAQAQTAASMQALKAFTYAMYRYGLTAAKYL